MTIHEYGENNPHPDGFVGIHVSVARLGQSRINKRYNFAGKSKAQIKAMRIEAQEFHDYAVAQNEALKAATLPDKPSSNTLSDVFGLSVNIAKRKKRNIKNRPGHDYSYEVYIAVAGAGTPRRGSGAPTERRFTTLTTRYNYEWFAETWIEACHLLASVRGMTEPPDRWIEVMPSKRRVSRFIAEKTQCA